MAFWYKLLEVGNMKVSIRAMHLYHIYDRYIYRFIDRCISNKNK